jgi:hypothetical protein
MTRVPTPSAEVAHVAVPAASAFEEQPEIATPPLVKATVPVGVPKPPVTFAVKVTLVFWTDGLSEEASETAAVCLGTFTVCESVLDVLVA